MAASDFWFITPTFIFVFFAGRDPNQADHIDDDDAVDAATQASLDKTDNVHHDDSVDAAAAASLNEADTVNAAGEASLDDKADDHYKKITIARHDYYNSATSCHQKPGFKDD